MKIAIIGYSGSGKSTLARQLADRYHCTALHLDAIHFTAGWESRGLEEILADQAAVLDQDTWVIDGNYRQFDYDRRMAEADQILFLNFPRRICLPRVIKRYFRNRGRPRPDMAAGCPEKIDWEFFTWVMWKGRTRQIKDNYREVGKKYAHKFVEMKNPKRVANYLAEK